MSAAISTGYMNRPAVTSASASSPARDVLVDRRLVGVGAIEQALAGDAGQQPGQLGDLGDVGLAVEEHLLRVQPAASQHGGDLQRRALDARRFVALDQRVVVGQEVEVLGAGAAAGRDRRADRADVVAQVRRAGGGDAGEVADERERSCGHG